jgi:hypothetical protein
MIKAKKATIIKSGKEFILVNPETDIQIEKLCGIFGTNTIKVNSNGLGLFEIEALYGNENYFSSLEEISNLNWKDIII